MRANQAALRTIIPSNNAFHQRGFKICQYLIARDDMAESTDPCLWCGVAATHPRGLRTTKGSAALNHGSWQRQNGLTGFKTVFARERVARVVERSTSDESAPSRRGSYALQAKCAKAACARNRVAVLVKEAFAVMP
jgi:hypothetical protein